MTAKGTVGAPTCLLRAFYDMHCDNIYLEQSADCIHFLSLSSMQAQAKMAQAFMTTILQSVVDKVTELKRIETKLEKIQKELESCEDFVAPREQILIRDKLLEIKVDTNQSVKDFFKLKSHNNDLRRDVTGDRECNRDAIQQGEALALQIQEKIEKYLGEVPVPSVLKL
jgi:hypothetical protein